MERKPKDHISSNLYFPGSELDLKEENTSKLFSILFRNQRRDTYFSTISSGSRRSYAPLSVQRVSLTSDEYKLPEIKQPNPYTAEMSSSSIF